MLVEIGDEGDAVGGVHHLPQRGVRVLPELRHATVVLLGRGRVVHLLVRPGQSERREPQQRELGRRAIA